LRDYRLAWLWNDVDRMGGRMAKESGVMAGPPLRSALIGEFVGTALLVLLGDGVVAGNVLINDAPDGMMVTTGWGLAVAMAVYLSGRLSGGHINPAVTLALAARGSFPRERVLPCSCTSTMVRRFGPLSTSTG
jgi:hypothetical protein